MTRITKHIFSLLFGLLLGSFAFGQKDWSLVNNENWIQIYKSNMSNSSYKRIKVECTVEGSVDKLLRILNDVNNHKNWIYNTKNAYIIKRVNANEYYYYTETSLPWPMQNRDAVVHIKFQKETNGLLTIAAAGEPTYLPEINGKVRVPRSANSWQVTPVGTNKIHIVYIFEADPGGHLPPWLVNTFVNKGPYESFRKLAEILKN
jgi:hypothetical protein